MKIILQCLLVLGLLSGCSALDRKKVSETKDAPPKAAAEIESAPTDSAGSEPVKEMAPTLAERRGPVIPQPAPITTTSNKVEDIEEDVSAIVTKPVPPIEAETPEISVPVEKKKISATTAGPVKEKLRPTPIKSDKPDLPVDDFTASRVWEVQSWANPAELVTAKRDKRNVLIVEMQEGEKGKVAISKSIRLDLSNRTKMNVELNVTGKKQVGVALAMFVVPEVGSAAKYYESPALPVKPGKAQAISFDLQKSNFKTAPNWEKFTSKVPNLSTVREIILLFYGEAGTAVELYSLNAALK